MAALEEYFLDNQNCWALQSDGSYRRLIAEPNQKFRVQEHQYQRAVEELKEAERMRRTMFEPHQPTTQQVEAI
jgi:polyphosphate kinase